MPSECPFCLQADLPHAASRCFHCGSWLDQPRDSQDATGFQRQIREDVKADLREHREFLQGLLAQLRSIAAIVVALALGAAVYFGIQTDQSISETADRIGDQATESIKLATKSVETEARAKVRNAVEERMRSSETEELIEEAIGTSVRASVKTAVEAKFAETSKTIDEMLTRSLEDLGEVKQTIDTLRADSEAASGKLDAIVDSFGQARRQTVESSRSVLPVEAVNFEGKGDLHELRQLVESSSPVNAIGFTLGGGYFGPIIWKYFVELLQRPEFRYVLVFDHGNQITAYYEARTLVAALNPENQSDLVEEHGSGSNSIPADEAVPQWNRFAEMLQRTEFEALASLPSFEPTGQPVRADLSSLDALDHMERQGANKVPVLDASGRFAGFIDRSRLTTSLVLDLARSDEP